MLIKSKLRQVEKVLQSPASWMKKKALHFWGKSKVKARNNKKSAEFLDNIRNSSAVGSERKSLMHKSSSGLSIILKTLKVSAFCL